MLVLTSNVYGGWGGYLNLIYLNQIEVKHLCFIAAPITPNNDNPVDPDYVVMNTFAGECKQIW